MDKDNINYKEFNSNSIYKKLSYDELVYIIGNKLSWKAYEKIEGIDSKEKATFIKNKFEKELKLNNKTLIKEKEFNFVIQHNFIILLDYKSLINSKKVSLLNQLISVYDITWFDLKPAIRKKLNKLTTQLSICLKHKHRTVILKYNN